MKRTIRMMTAVAGWVLLASALFADTAPTYQALSWKAAGTDIVAFDAKYVNVYAEIGGTRIGGDARSAFTPSTFDVAATSVVQGVEGWAWGSQDPADATFRVELLNADLGTIATSEGVPYATLKAADALEINYSGSGVPLPGGVPYLFSTYTVAGDGGVYAYLTNLLASCATVVPQTSASGAVTNMYVTFTDDVTGPLVLAGNLGRVTLDLNGCTIAGTNAVIGTAAEGGNAIEVAGAVDPGLATTELVIVDKSNKGYKGTVTGGRGADDATGTSGGHAISSSFAGVSVRVLDGVTVKGGDSGNSTTGAKTPGQSALSNVTLAEGTVEQGADGTGHRAWAWCTCTFSGTLPDGTTQGSDGTLYFWKGEGTSDVARATFDFGALAGQTVADRTVTFADELVHVGSLAVPASAGDLTFAGQDHTILDVDALESAFDVTSSDGQVRAWTNLAFACDFRAEWSGSTDGLDGFASDGGAIRAVGGAIRVTDCSFEKCAAGQLGGAICAERLAADSEIASSLFATNAAVEGGALYASSHAAGSVTLTVTNCVFEGNSADGGGAISTFVIGGAGSSDERPAALAVFDSSFLRNEAFDVGGAIKAEGDVSVDATATHGAPGSSAFTGNAAGVGGGAIEVVAIDTDQTPVDVRLGRGVAFAFNVVSNGLYDATGAAVDMMIDCSTFRAEGVSFASNAVYGAYVAADEGALGAAGGAIACAWNATNAVDTCVFDGNVTVTNGAAGGIGAALVFWDGETVLRNATFRRANVEAVCADGGRLVVTNCVLVGNGAAGDIVLRGTANPVDADIAYTAYGAIALDGNAAPAEYMNLSNRTDAIYAGESLRLDPTGFNPVAALGYEQPGVYDFDGVEYGSLPVGSSMGAYETPTAPVVVDVAGLKTYDGSASSNGCAWTWRLTDTNGADVGWSDLTNAQALAECFTITNWTHGCKDAGAFHRTNAAPWNLTAEFEPASDAIAFWVEAGFVTFEWSGAIARRPVAQGGLAVELLPDEYAWTGERVLANVSATDTMPAGGETLAEGTDYRLEYAGNVDPTSNAVVTVTFLRNYEGATNRLYAITAYYVECAFDGTVAEDLTKIHGETSGVAVAVLPAEYLDPVPAGYCLDDQYSPTNGTVRRVADGALRLQLLYCTDANGDQVPDKYQRKVLAKVLNGQWDDLEQGRDAVRYVTLTNAAGGWSATGTGALTEAVPSAGSRYTTGFAEGGWLGFVNGRLAVVDPATFSFTSNSVPFLIYAYGHATRNRRGWVASSVPLADQYAAFLTVTDATFVGQTMKLKTQLFVKDRTSGEQTESVTVTDESIRLYMVERLGDDWLEVASDAITTEGGYTVIDLGKASPAGTAGFFKAGLK